ncbi:unnamed protein product [Phyllotreta striolata]|uniref:PX domain-containing protein n=1 Tax=Phyllotreta striolata TaxID=444603 RepID=A0A9N9TH84_PHYSR|nr:unnamed protein product [Phyllotreta striolata]
MESKTSAVLDVVVENKENPSVFKEKEIDPSSVCSDSTYDNSLAQSPSIESFSTIHDIENLSELNMDENSDLCVKIDNPQKHLETLETYITFRITTKVARIEFTDNEYIVHRRYNDFLWLRQKLVEGHPFCIVPPLPGKHSLIGQLDRYSKDFILVRMKSLNVFVSRVAKHPILSCDEHFKGFLTLQPGDFVLHRRQRHPVQMKSIRFDHRRSSGSTSNKHSEFERTKAYLGALSEKLASIERISGRVNKERSEYVTELNNFHPIFTTWATSEPHLAELLSQIGGATERSSAAQSALIHAYGNTMGNPIREFLSYIEVAQETLKKREFYQYSYETSVEELNKRHFEKDKLVSNQRNPSQSSSGFSLWKSSSSSSNNSEEKLEKLGVCIPQLIKKVETDQDNLECANESLRSDFQRWQSEKQHCLKKILLDFVDRQIDFYRTSCDSWEFVAGEINRRNGSNQK